MMGIASVTMVELSAVSFVCAVSQRVRRRLIYLANYLTETNMNSEGLFVT